jgi:autotransporter-associated beta strand protein
MFNNTLALNKRIAFTNANFNNDSGANIIVGPVVLDGGCTIDVDGGTSLAISNIVSGPGGSLTKVETGTLLLSSVNTYAGDTFINAGTLALIGAGSLTSPNINLGGGTAALEVGARVDGTLTLGSGRALNGYGAVRGTVQANASATVSLGGDTAIGQLNITNALLLNAGSTTYLDVDKAGFTNDVIGAGSVSYGGTLKVTEISGTPFGAGNTFKLFNASSYQGTFTAFDPATPGAGLKWNTNNLAVNGTLKVESVAPLPQPNIASFSYTGTDVTLVGTGPAYGTYLALTSTNVGLPIGSWTIIATNYFDGGGAFNLTTPVDPGEARRFFRLRVP